MLTLEQIDALPTHIRDGPAVGVFCGHGIHSIEVWIQEYVETGLAAKDYARIMADHVRALWYEQALFGLIGDV